MKKLLFSSVLFLAANLLYGASMSSSLDDDHLYVFDITEHGLDADGKDFNSGYIWGEIGDAVTLLNPFEDVIRTRSFGTVIKVNNQIINVDYTIQGSQNPKDEDGSNPALSLSKFLY